MTAHVKYYALVLAESTRENPSGLFRIKQHEHRFEFYDSRVHRWVQDNSLARFIWKGEPGAEEVTAVEAHEIIRKWGG